MIRWVRGVGIRLLMLALGSAGCSFLPSHIHDPGNAALATKVQSELAAYAENAPSMYQAMLTNLEKFKVEEDKVIVDLAVNREKAFVTLLPTQNQSDLAGLKSEIEKRISRLECDVKNEANKYLIAKEIIKKDLDDAQKALAKVKEAVAAAKDDVDNWNASVALLKRGVAEIPSIAEMEKKESAEDGLKSFTDKLKDIGNKEVEFVDATGKTQKKKIADILKDQIQVKDGNKLILDLPEAPGMTLTIVTLGLELAEMQQKSAELRMTQLSRRAELYEDAYGEILLAKQLLQETDFGVADNVAVHNYLLRVTIQAHADYQEVTAAAKEGSFQEPFTEFYSASRKFFNRKNTTAKTLIDLRKLSLADSITARTQAMLRLAAARFDHQQSILLSRLNDEAWQAVLKSGVDGLVAYHQGGFTREDAANIIRIAQTFAVGVIAGRVD